MAELVTLLGTASIVLTFSGSYRFTKFFFPDDPLYAGLLASSSTLVYMMFFQYVLLAVGIATLLVPIGLWVRTDRLPMPSAAQLVGDRGQDVAIAETTDGPGRLNAYPQCPNPSCNEPYHPSAEYCRHCGEKLPGEAQP